MKSATFGAVHVKYDAGQAAAVSAAFQAMQTQLVGGKMSRSAGGRVFYETHAILPEEAVPYLQSTKLFHKVDWDNDRQTMTWPQRRVAQLKAVTFAV